MKNKHTNATLERHLPLEAMLGTEIQKSQLCNCMGHTCSYISIWGNRIYTAVWSNPAIHEPSYTQEQLNSKNAIKEGWGEKKKTTRRPWRSCPPVQAGAWAGKWRLLQFRKSGGPGVILLLADVKPSSSRGEGSSPFLVSQGSGQGSGCSRNAWWHSDWPGGLRDLWDLYMNIPLQSGADGNPETVITKGIISSISLSISP